MAEFVALPVAPSICLRPSSISRLRLNRDTELEDSPVCPGGSASAKTGIVNHPPERLGHRRVRAAKIDVDQGRWPGPRRKINWRASLISQRAPFGQQENRRGGVDGRGGDFAACGDCGARAAVRNVAQPPVLGRVYAGFFMGSLTIALIGLAAATVSTAALLLVQLIVPVAMIATVLVVTLSPTARAAWGRLCLINGILSVSLAAASIEGRGQPLWPSDPGYGRALDQGVHWWLTHVISTAVTYFGGAVVVAAALFALSYWLLRSPHGQRHDVH
jgi:hypothetical protein